MYFIFSDISLLLDWIHDRIKEGVRKRKFRDIPGIRGELMKASDASQAWILVTLIGVVVAIIAWFIDVVQEWMSDLKQGYCTTNWKLNSKFCCQQQGKKLIQKILLYQVIHLNFKIRILRCMENLARIL